MSTNTYSGYVDDPVGFGENVLKESYTDDVKRLMESVRDNIVTVGVSANATGKTHGAARVAVWFYKSFTRSQVYTAAAPPERNLKKLLWGEIGEVLHRNPLVFDGDRLTNLNIERTSKQFISGVTIPASGTAQEREAKFSGKHAPYLLFIVDEGDAVPDDVYAGIESCMSGGHARLLIMFNPRRQSGFVYRLIRDNKANIVRLSAFDHPNVTTGDNVYDGAVTRETTVRRINEWTVAAQGGKQHPENEVFEVPKCLIGATAVNAVGVQYEPLEAGLRKIIDPAFSYMVLGEYPSQAVNSLISLDWINRARTRYDVFMASFGGVPPKNVRPILGLDVAEGEVGSDLNSACLRYGGFVAPIETWGGLDTIETSERGINIYRKTNASICNADATAVGAGVAPYMRRKRCTAASIKVAESPTEKTEQGEFGLLRDQIWWAVREFLRTDVGAMLPPDEELIEELQIPTYSMVKGKIKIMSKDEMKQLLQRSPDKADALGLTFAPVKKRRIGARNVKIRR